MFDGILNIFAVPVSYILQGLRYVFGQNFALLMFLLTFIVNLLMLPLSVKTQKSTAKQQMLRPKIDALKKKYGENLTQQEKMQLNQETQELYKKEGVSMAGGCLPLLIRLPFLLAVYRVIQSPLTYLFNLGQDKIDALLKAINATLPKGSKIATTGYYELPLLNYLSDNIKGIPDNIVQQLDTWNFSFFGIDLKKTPEFSFNFASVTKEQAILWIIPFMALAAQLLTSFISMQITKKANPDQPNMALMMYMMPLITLFFAFSLPAAVGLYWAFSSLVAGLMQAGVQIFYSPKRLMAAEQAKYILKEYKEEQQRIN